MPLAMPLPQQVQVHPTLTSTPSSGQTSPLERPSPGPRPRTARLYSSQSMHEPPLVLAETPLAPVPSKAEDLECLFPPVVSAAGSMEEIGSRRRVARRGVDVVVVGTQQRHRYRAQRAAGAARPHAGCSAGPGGLRRRLPWNHVAVVVGLLRVRLASVD